ncbi:hypothetical protein AX14_007649 [Amanita brunnescens Koide BX004]|nr:hypothetical protein AX14_007649 [Amanita brunnescens Koide BX004]
MCDIRRSLVGDDLSFDNVPAVFKNYGTGVEVDGNHCVELALWDTAGKEDYDRLRPFSYPDSHAILICFAVNNPDSLEKSIQELTHFGLHLPIVLAGCKKDLMRRPIPVLLRNLGTSDSDGSLQKRAWLSLMPDTMSSALPRLAMESAKCSSMLRGLLCCVGARGRIPIVQPFNLRSAGDWFLRHTFLQTLRPPPYNPQPRLYPWP